MVCIGLISWMVRKQEFNLKNFAISKLSVSCGIFYYEDDTVKFIVDEAVYEKIVATGG